MKKSVYINGKLSHVEEGTPVCGEDFCDTCGDCLHCYGWDQCGAMEEGRTHYWVEDREAQDASDAEFIL